VVETSPPNHHFRCVRFIPPAIPVLKPASPAGPDWLHEVKFDGWRLQIHKSGEHVKLYSRRGVDMARRFADLRDACLYLPEAVIDAELVACDTDGKPDFPALRQPHPNLCVWCFDLLALAGQDIREQPLSHRREQLRELLIATDDDKLRFSEEFTDPVKLLKVAEKMGRRRDLEAPDIALPVRHTVWLDQGQDGFVARYQQGSRRTLSSQ
jgi:bifunctional non-homologous end joining protein LigD